MERCIGYMRVCRKSPGVAMPMIATGRRKRKSIVEYLKRQGRFAHFTEEDIAYFQSQVDEIWEKWGTPGVSQVRLDVKGDRA